MRATAAAGLALAEDDEDVRHAVTGMTRSLSYQVMDVKDGEGALALRPLGGSALLAGEVGFGKRDGDRLIALPDHGAAAGAQLAFLEFAHHLFDLAALRCLSLHHRFAFLPVTSRRPRGGVALRPRSASHAPLRSLAREPPAGAAPVRRRARCGGSYHGNPPTGRALYPWSPAVRERIGRTCRASRCRRDV